jgi:hypothetical protein
MVSTSLMVDTSSHPRAQLHRCVERSAYDSAASLNLEIRIESPSGGGSWVSRSFLNASVMRAMMCCCRRGLPPAHRLAHPCPDQVR